VFRAYFLCAAAAMMADSIEHVISYWIMFQKFQSPALAGFAVISHWLPFLLFSLWSGGLADRYDPRRLIQIGMALFMAASIGWGVLFLTDSLEMWHAAVLLVLHGLAGVLWNPAAQLFIHDIVGEKELHSAIRLTAIARWLGLLMGPAVGGVILSLSALCFLTVVIGTWTAGRRIEAPAFEFAVPLHAPGGPGIWDRYGLWTIVAIVLVVAAYAYPLMQLLAHPRFGSPAFKPF